MDVDTLCNNIRRARATADMQPGSSMARTAGPALADPAAAHHISPEDLIVLKEQFPSLSNFSEDFLKFRTIDELLRLASTSMQINSAEKARETEDRLAQNKAGMHTKFFDVQAGRDNRCTELHPARFLPGAGCSAARQYITAREVLGLSSPPPLACYDMAAVGMAGYVTARGWLE